MRAIPTIDSRVNEAYAARTRQEPARKSLLDYLRHVGIRDMPWTRAYRP